MSGFLLSIQHEGEFILTVEVTVNTTVAATSVPVGGTPEAPTERAFRPPREFLWPTGTRRKQLACAPATPRMWVC